MGFLNKEGLKYLWDTYIAREFDKKVDKVNGKGLSTNDYTTTEKNKLAGIAAGAEVNQNAFSNVIVGNTTIAADAKTDSLTIVAGENVTITPDANNDKITIKATDTVYTHPTHTSATEGLYKVTVDAEGHVSKTTKVTKADITALGITDTDTKYTEGAGIDISDSNVISNTGVRSIGTGTANGTISVNTNGTSTDVAIKGLGSAAYTASTAYATSAQGTKADNAMPKTGGAFEGYITLKGDPTANLHPVTKQYLDGELLELSDTIGTKANSSDLTSHTGNKNNPHGVTKTQIGLGNVENKSSEIIRSELTSANVTTALGYTPSQVQIITWEADD